MTRWNLSCSTAFRYWQRPLSSRCCPCCQHRSSHARCRLRIGGRTLYIIANRLIAEKGARIEAFPPQQSSKLERAQDAGHVRIVLFETPVAADKPLVISLRGEDGRDGEQGSNASPRKVAWRPPSRQYEQRLVPLLQSAPVGRDDVPECSEAENRRRWSMIDWAALGPVYKGPISDNVANIRRLLACAEKDPPKGGGTTDPGQQSAKSEGTDPGRRSAKSGADRSAKAIQQDFAEIDELLGKKGNVLMCLRSVDAGHPGANGHPMAINGGNGRDGGRGGSVIAIYPEANGERPSWLQIETNGGQGGWAGLPGRPQEGGDGEVAVDTPMHLASCGPALAGPPGEDGASGMPGHRGRNGSEGQASFVRLPDLR